MLNLENSIKPRGIIQILFQKGFSLKEFNSPYIIGAIFNLLQMLLKRLNDQRILLRRRILLRILFYNVKLVLIFKIHSPEPPCI